MIDRLSDLRSVAEAKNPQGAQLLQQGPSAACAPLTNNSQHVQFSDKEDIELGTEDAAALERSSSFMADFFEEVGVIRTGLNQIRENVDGIKALKKHAIQAASPQREKEVSVKLNILLDDTNKRVMTTKKQLSELKQNNIKFAQKNKDTSETRIRDNMHGNLTRKFQNTLTEYQKAQTSYKQEVMHKVVRQVKIVYPDATPEELSEMVEAGEMSSAMAIKSRMTGGHEDLQNAIGDIQDKYRDIRRLEGSVAELHQMFVELATLVDAQGEMLNQIEHSVKSAKDYTEKGEVELVAARKHQETAKKRMVWLSICLIVLAIIIVLPLVVILTK
eukprot:GHVN01003644.1.p1 GENE.GHVN01003644.1~~GHVN01003644.1.p1  ORF type:complete len:331 (-),score=68.90 GHVN01003644.1:2371-3363(-)